MLKSLNQPRLSPASASASPRFQQYQYGSSSPQTTPNTPRRKSTISEPSPAPARKVVQYVDRGTQYSPLMEKPSEQSLKQIRGFSQQILQPEEPAPLVIATAPIAATMPALGVESPAIKKRRSRDELPHDRNSHQILPQKRTRPAQTAVKLLPSKYELCDVEDIVVLIANMISELLETNDDLPLRSGVLTRFHSRTPPGISVLDYLQRLAKHATLTPPLLLSMVYYIDRLCSLYPAFTITTLTVHRFLITAATVAAKGLSDSFWNNATYARVGGIKLAELGLLELEFLYRVDWKIVPNPEVLVDYYRGLVKRSNLYELEGDVGSDEDEDVDDNEAEIIESPDVKSGAATDLEWKAWMEDVSKGKVGKEGKEGKEEVSD